MAPPYSKYAWANASEWLSRLTPDAQLFRDAKLTRMYAPMQLLDVGRKGARALREISAGSLTSPAPVQCSITQTILNYDVSLLDCALWRGTLPSLELGAEANPPTVKLG